MPRARTAALAFTDWVKILIVLAVAIGAWWYVYAVYTEPFDLAADIKWETALQYARSTPPFIRAIPPGGGGTPVELKSAPR